MKRLLSFSSFAAVSNASNEVLRAIIELKKPDGASPERGGFLSVGDNFGKIYFTTIVGQVFEDRMDDYFDSASFAIRNLGKKQGSQSSNETGITHGSEIAIRAANTLFSFDGFRERKWNAAFALAVAAKATSHLVDKKLVQFFITEHANEWIKPVFRKIGITITKNGLIF